MKISKEEIFKEEKLDIKKLTIDELVKLAVKLYETAERTVVKWHDADNPKCVSLNFIDSAGTVFESLEIDKIIYRRIIKPAILSINN